jgi:membrane-bound lytic murein transglycosylase A
MPSTRPALCLLLVIAAALICLDGCAVKEPPPVTRENAMVRIEPSQLPDFMDDLLHDKLQHGIDQSIAYLKRISPSTPFSFGKDRVSAEHMVKSLERFGEFIGSGPSKTELKAFIAENYRVYKSVGKAETGQVLFTGYYEPLLLGSLEQSNDYRYPVYGLPEDLISIDLSLFSDRFKGEKIIGRFTGDTVLPYYDRKEIEAGVIDGKAVPLAWVKDPVDLFFLHIQGSGKIYLDPAESIHVHYHGSNGRPYASIGKLLIDTGKIPKSEMSMQRIRAYLHEHPQEMQSILNSNPSYVFFKLEPDGPLGYLEVKLTPGRSIAVDRRLFPMAALAYIETQKPLVDGDGRIFDWPACRRFVLIQDTGGAIRGPGRTDLFWGNGPYAEIAAGHMQHPGTLYFLVLKEDGAG